MLEGKRNIFRDFQLKFEHLTIVDQCLRETKLEREQTCKKARPRDHWPRKYFRLWKVKGWNTVEFVETISLNSMN